MFSLYRRFSSLSLHYLFINSSFYYSSQANSLIHRLRNYCISENVDKVIEIIQSHPSIDVPINLKEQSLTLIYAKSTNFYYALKYYECAKQLNVKEDKQHELLLQSDLKHVSPIRNYVRSIGKETPPIITHSTIGNILELPLRRSRDNSSKETKKESYDPLVDILKLFK